MKRKIFSVLFAVVLLLSFSLVTAAPVAAVAADAIPKATFTTNGSGTAVWSTTSPDAGTYSAELTLTADVTDHAVVQVFLPAGITLANLEDMSYTYYVDSTGSDIVNQGGIATKDGWSDSVPVYQAPYLSICFSAEEVPGGIVQHEVAVITSIDDWATDTIGGDEVWHSTFDGDNHTFSEYLSLYGTEEVTSVCLQLDKNGTDDTVTAHSYVGDITINEVTYAMEPRVINTDTPEGFNTIQAAITAATASDTITVAAGTYTENVVIDEALTLNSVDGKATTIIDASGGSCGIDITATGVTVDGFTVDGPAADYGIRIQNDDVIIQNNTIDSAGTSIMATSLIDNAHVLNNLISNTDRGIYMGVSATNWLIEGNTISGNLNQDPVGIHMIGGSGEAPTKDNIIKENTISDDIDDISCGIHLAGEGAGLVFEDNQIEGNTISGASPYGIETDSDLTITGLLITENDISGSWEDGIRIQSWEAAEGTSVINYNNIYGNGLCCTSCGGIKNRTEIAVDAKYNYWDDPSGPTITATNPRGAGDAVSTYVDYEPWLHTTQATVYPSGIRYYAYNWCDLTKGWNIWSTPIAPDTQADTWGEYKALGTDLDLASGSNAYYFDASTPGWASVTDAYVLTPCDAIYIKVASDQEAPILFSPSVSAPSKTLYAGWNLVSASYINSMDSPTIATGEEPQTVLASVYNVAGANNLGYSQVVSPAVNQTAWSGVRLQNIDSEVGGENDMLPCKGYWVYMTNAGTLAGTVFTPVSPLQ